MMPIRDVVIFPFMMTPFVVGRESSVRALEEALLGDKKIEIGAGLGPLAGKVFRVGLMGAGSTAANVDLLLNAFSEVTR